jgi:hypothetical protein
VPDLVFEKRIRKSAFAIVGIAEMKRRPGSKQSAMKDERFLDKEGLRKKLSLPSTRNVDEMMRSKRIPYLRLGHRTVRFDWPKVEKALARLEVKEVGRIEEAA